MKLDAAGYTRIKTLFQQAREVPAGQRAAWVEKAAEGDAALAAEVMSLLAADSGSGDLQGYLQRPLNASAQSLPAGALLAGEGQYRLLSELGSGGMGTVYLAERVQGGFKQQVAIKFSTLGAGNPELLARFRAERQFLARLSHPNIARLLDGGSGPDGAPFLVMEYVEGQRIDDWCAAHQLGARARVALFVKVCRAVQVAHQNLIVHRDLKPANILVDTQGEPKLLDFGIAKLLGEGEADFTQAETREGAQLLTPRYASPEQVRGEAVTTAADIYALGVVLYELLTGRSPYSLGSASTPELARAVLDSEPRRPSSPARAEETLAAGATTQFDFSALARELRGDLDAILLKCLRKEPGARYASAAALADDLERQLDGRPVLAHRGSGWYRTRKLVVRHKAAVAGVVAFVVLLIASVIALSLQLERTRIERDKSERVTAFLLDLFKQADPTRSRGETITVQEVLERGAARLGADPDLPAATRTSMQATIGSVFHQLGLYPLADPLLTAALAQLAQTSPGSAEHIETLSEFGALRLDQGQLPEAARLANEAMALQGEFAAGDFELQGRVAYKLGLVRLRQGELAAAKAAFDNALAAFARVGMSNSPEAAETLNGLANWYRDSGDSRAAEQYFGRALEIFRSGGRDRWAEARSLNNLAVLRLDQSDFEGAERLLREALLPMRAALGDEHPLIGAALGNLAGVLNRRGRFDEAAVVFEESLALRRKLHGEEHPAVVLTLSNRAYNDYSRGDFVAAEADMRKALALQVKTQGVGHQHTLATERNLAALRFARGDLVEAAALYKHMIAEGSKTLTAEHPLIWVSRQRLALLQALTGDAAAARDELHAVLAAQEGKLGNAHIEVAETRVALAVALALAGDSDASCAATRLGFKDLSTQLAATHPDLLLGAALLAQCEQSAGDTAATALESAVSKLAARYGANHPLLTRLDWKP